MDYSFFDSLIDGVIIFDQQKVVSYCNESAASLVGLSVRRILKNKKVFELIEFSDKNLFTMPDGKYGEEQAVPTTELEFKIVKSNAEGKIQITLQPFQELNEKLSWVLVLHDVTLEETLHTKYHGQLEAKEEVIEELKTAKLKIESYSRNLEQMVEQRTEALNQANRTLQAIMNSLGQGFLTFNSDGLCGDIYTKACEAILETNPHNKMIWEVLGVEESGLKHIKMWLQACFEENLAFENLKDLGPNKFNHSKGWHVQLEFYPIRDPKGKIIQIVMVATDKTKEIEAERAMEQEKQNSLMIIKLVKNRSQFVDFIKSTNEKLKWLSSLNKDNFKIEEAFRVLHTLEGEAGIFAIKCIVDKAKECQQALQPLKSKTTNEDKKMRDEFINKIFDLDQTMKIFLKENKHLFDTFSLFDGEEKIFFTLKTIENYFKFLNSEPTNSQAMDKFDNEFRKTDIKTLFAHFNDVTQIIAEKTNKKLLPIKIKSNNVKVYSKKIKPIINSLVHVFRNAVDHGIEAPSERIEKNKSEFGKIEIETHQSKNGILIQIFDDGKGIHPDVIRQKLPLKSEGLNNDETLQLIFEPGFSSKNELSEYSGRGVGMDAVKNAVTKCGGHVYVESVVGHGTKLTIELPQSHIDNKNISAA